jgi:hypothetical protein
VDVTDVLHERQQCLLDGVLGIGAPAQNAQRHAQHRRAVELDQLLHRTRLSGLCAANELDDAR